MPRAEDDDQENASQGGNQGSLKSCRWQSKALKGRSREALKTWESGTLSLNRAGTVNRMKLMRDAKAGCQAPGCKVIWPWPLLNSVILHGVEIHINSATLLVTGFGVQASAQKDAAHQGRTESSSQRHYHRLPSGLCRTSCSGTSVCVRPCKSSRVDLTSPKAGIFLGS